MPSDSSRPGYSDATYHIRHAKNLAETRELWWPNMLEVQWNRGPSDLATYMDHSIAKGMLLAFPTSENAPVGHVAAVINENSTGWVAMFIVKAGYRGLRLGAALWDAMMEDFRAAKCEYIGLDAVPAQKLTYERRGFVESKLGIIKFLTLPLSQVPQQPATSPQELLPIQSVDPVILAEYERRYTGFYRPALWRNFTKRADVVGVVAAQNKHVSSADDIVGIAALRRAPLGVRLSPLYANDASAVETVLLATLSKASPAYIRQHIMEDYPLHELSDADLLSRAVVCTEMWTGNSQTDPLFSKYGWTEAAMFHRMWLNDKATSEQSAGGSAGKGLFSIFDAAIG